MPVLAGSILIVLYTMSIILNIAQNLNDAMTVFKPWLSVGLISKNAFRPWPFSASFLGF